MTTLPDRSKDHINPLDYAKMLTESLVKSKTPFTPEIIEELKNEFQATFDKIPGELCERYICLFDPLKPKEEKNKGKGKRKKEKKKASVSKERIKREGNDKRFLNWAVSLIPHLRFEENTLPIHLAAYIGKEFNLNLKIAQKIAARAIKKHEKIKDKKIEFKSADQLIKDPNVQTIIPQSEAPDPGIKSLSTLKVEPKKLVTKVSKKPVLKKVVIPKVKTSEVRLSHGIDSHREIILDDRDKKIIFQFSVPKVAAYVFPYLKIPKSSFYRKLNRLIDLGILVKLDKNKYSRISVSPRFRKSVEMGLVVSSRASPKKQLTSQSAPISQRGFPVRNIESHSQAQAAEISSKSEMKRGTSETAYDITSQKASISDSTDKSQNSHSDPRASSVPIPSKSKKQRAKNETRSKLTSEKPSFSELLAKFDPHNLRSHSFLFSVEIVNPPVDYQQKLAEDSNWLETFGGMKNWTWYSRRMEFYNIEVVVRFYTKKITIRIIEIWGTDSFINDSIADDVVLRTLETITKRYKLKFGEIEKIFGKPLKKRFKVKIKDTHHALPFHPIAVKAIEAGVNHIKTDYWEVDQSKDPELEAINKNSASEDVRNHVADLDYMAKNNRYIRDMDSDIKQQSEIQEVTFENLAISNKKQESIKDSVNQNGNSLQTLIQRIDTFSKEIRSEKDHPFTEQEFQTNLLTAIDNMTSFLVDIKGELTEVNISLSSKKRIIPVVGPVPAALNFENKKLKEILPEILELNPQGLTRKEIAKKYRIRIGSVNGTVSRLMKQDKLYEHQHKLYLKKQGE